MQAVRIKNQTMSTIIRHIAAASAATVLLGLQVRAQSLVYVADSTATVGQTARADTSSAARPDVRNIPADTSAAALPVALGARADSSAAVQAVRQGALSDASAAVSAPGVPVYNTAADFQNPPVSFEALLASADSLRLCLDFAAAVAKYTEALEAGTDTLAITKAQEGLVQARNGQNMMSYCSHPVVVAHQEVPLRDFFLFYPLRDRSWRATPNPLDPSSDALASAIYIPDSTKTVYYSSPDGDGIRNLYRTRHENGQWAVPQLINENLTSSSDEIYPMLSQDGKTLYFASKGLYGMGGYDLYMSRWNKDTKDWDTPINMGFPYSSPYDDFLFTNTEDGRYTIFASNRDCRPDSVCIYVLEYDAMPVRKGVRSVEELRAVVALEPEKDLSRMDNSATIEKESEQSSRNTSRYMQKMEEVSGLRDTIYRFNRSLDELRSALMTVPAEEQKAYISDIQERELALPQMQKRLNSAVKELQDIEMEFLTSGVAIDPDRLSERSDKEVVGASSSYTFVKNSMGSPVTMAVARPEPVFDYSFRILPEGQFAEDQSLPSGIIYQIQFASGSNRVSVRELKGLSPVFMKMRTSLVYTYSAGVFRSYADVLSQLNRVKGLGFRDAFITAYKDGLPVPVEAARAQENSAAKGYHDSHDGRGVSDGFSKSARALSSQGSLSK